jgi:hypothetical protein
MIEFKGELPIAEIKTIGKLMETNIDIISNQ